MRFIDNGDTITDTTTGLVWTEADAPSRLSWQAGQDWCAGLRIGGHDDWRMPTIQEWVAVLDYYRCKPTADPALGLHAASKYWSASTLAYYPTFAWFVYTDGGGAGGNYKAYDLYVRAVRSGSRSFDHLPDETLAPLVYHSAGVYSHDAAVLD